MQPFGMRKYVKMLDLFNLNGCIEDVDIKEGTYRRKK